jgi:hypothetical protein
VAERVLTANADVSNAAAPCSGRTALQAAAEDGHLEVVERLPTTSTKGGARRWAPRGGGKTGRTGILI